MAKQITLTNSTLGGKVGEEWFPYPMDQYAGESGATPGSFHIDHLKSKFRDLARPNQFRVKIEPPSVIESAWNEEDLMPLVKSASFPSIEIQPIELERAGKILYIPSNKMNFGELTITFLNDVDFKLRNLFILWQTQACFNWNRNVGPVPTIAFEGSVYVYQFDGSQKQVYAMGFDNAWPKTVSEIALSHDTENAIEEFSVTFVFSDIATFV